MKPKETCCRHDGRWWVGKDVGQGNWTAGRLTIYQQLHLAIKQHFGVKLFSATNSTFLHLNSEDWMTRAELPHFDVGPESDRADDSGRRKFVIGRRCRGQHTSGGYEVQSNSVTPSIRCSLLVTRWHETLARSRGRPPTTLTPPTNTKRYTRLFPLLVISSVLIHYNYLEPSMWLPLGYLTRKVTDWLIYGGHLIWISVKIVRGGGLRVKGVRGWPQMAAARFTGGRASSCSQWPTSGAIGRHLKRQRRRRRSHSGGATFVDQRVLLLFFPFALLLFHDEFHHSSMNSAVERELK